MSKKQKILHVGEDVETLESGPLSWEWEMVQLLWTTVWQVLKTLKIELSL